MPGTMVVPAAAAGSAKNEAARLLRRSGGGSIPFAAGVDSKDRVHGGAVRVKEYRVGRPPNSNKRCNMASGERWCVRGVFARYTGSTCGALM